MEEEHWNGTSYPAEEPSWPATASLPDEPESGYSAGESDRAPAVAAATEEPEPTWQEPDLPGEALVLNGVRRSFPQANARLEVIREASLTLYEGEMVALIGPSGSGKSTLLHMAGLLERPEAGEIWIAGQQVGRLGDSQRTALRRRSIGFVYQYHHLLPEFSALENIVLPQMIAGKRRKDAEANARDLLRLVGLSERASHRPAKLSGGEQQRVAIARALANMPGLLLADEPTGNLDEHTAADVFALLYELVHEFRLGALIATHNLELARRMDRVVMLHEGRLEQAS